MRKFKYFLDLEKEEKWLRDMAKQGYQLEDRSFGYKFRAAEPEDAVIKIDYRRFKKQEDFLEYRILFEDSGWKHIAGKKNSGAQYFQKMSEASDDDIFSDKLSKAGKYKRLSDMSMELSMCYLPLLVVLITMDMINLEVLVNPKALYFTPGLWEMTGVAFWRAFLFETPFAFFRGFAWLFIPVMMVLYLISAYKANKLYEKSKP
ncbi:DUF2812 domain-containing protein [Oceanobacillus halotolerans]|uniref:DUF2812 domain-containing protein n=1 Tax=Oceanobacillus halotolerans TaxID=2663380 RepID=UPI0013DB831C|nr:DUF2812 domain-containing protein [Oceanobacillus halotolerans]